MKKRSLVSLSFLLSVMLAGCNAASDSEQGAASAENQEDEALQEPGEQPEAMENEDKDEPNQTEEDSDLTDHLIYENNEYGFTFTLPKSWSGYTVVTDSWEGRMADEEQTDSKEEGPLLMIRHPKWTEENPRQDIPIMIFTREQWASLEKEEYFVSAAPIPPSKLGENDQYVFALPARYNYAFPEGYEEVEDILETNPLQPQQ